MTPPNARPNPEIQDAAARGRDFVDRMGYENTAQKLFEDMNQTTSSAVRSAELAGATRELTRLKLLPDITIEQQNHNLPTNYQVLGVSGDHNDLVIAAGEGPNPHYVTMDSNGIFYNAVLDKQNSTPGQPHYMRGEQYADNAQELDRKDGTGAPYWHSSVIRDSNNLPVDVTDVYHNEWKIQRGPDGTPGDIVTSGHGALHAWSRNPDGTYTENGQHYRVNIEPDGTFSSSTLKNIAPEGSTPHYVPTDNHKWSPRGFESGTYEVDNRTIQWDNESNIVTIRGDNHGPLTYTISQHDNNGVREYKSDDANDPKLYRMNWKIGMMVPVK